MGGVIRFFPSSAGMWLSGQCLFGVEPRGWRTGFLASTAPLWALNSPQLH